MSLKQQNLDRLQRIVTEGGAPSDYFIRFIQDRAGAVTDLDALLTELDTFLDDLSDVDIIAGDALTGGGSLSSLTDITIDHVGSAVTPGAYTNADITVDEFGHVTAAANGSGGGGGGGMTEIDEIVTSASAASITFATIAGSYKHLLVEVYGRTNVGADNDPLLFRFNGDSGSNYGHGRTGSFGSIMFGETGTGETSGLVGTLAGGSSQAGTVGNIKTYIPHYAGTTWKKFAHGIGASVGSGAPINMENSFYWLNTAAITDIVIVPQGGSAFVDGTIATLWGIG